MALSTGVIGEREGCHHGEMPSTSTAPTRQGRPDRRFGRNGIARLRRPSGRWIDDPRAVAAVPDGVVIAGAASPNAHTREDFGPERVLIARRRLADC